MVRRTSYPSPAALECDDDKERFEAKLRKIAKADSKGPREGR
jgi:hypothetical protein